MKSRIVTFAMLLSVLPLQSFAECQAVNVKTQINKLKLELNKVDNMSSNKLVNLQRKLLKSMLLPTNNGSELSQEEKQNIARLSDDQFLYFHLKKDEVRKSFDKFYQTVGQSVDDTQQTLSATEMFSRNTSNHIAEDLDLCVKGGQDGNGEIKKGLESDIGKIADIANEYAQFDSLLEDLNAKVMDELIQEMATQNTIKETEREIKQTIREMQNKNKNKSKK